MDIETKAQEQAGAESLNAQDEQVAQDGEAVFTDAPSGNPDAEGAKEQTTDENTQKTDAAEAVRRANAAAAHRRREEQRKAELERVRAEEREKTILETLGGVNPFTGEEMKDSTDVAEFLEMQDIKKRGGDPVAEYAKYHKQFERERADRAAQEERKQNDNRRDLEQFEKDYPGVGVKGLLADKNFLTFAEGQIGVVPLSKIYGNYRRIGARQDAQVEERARAMAAQMIANGNASPGSAVGSPDAGQQIFTPERVRAMSKQEVHENYNNIVKSMKYWN